MMFQKGLGGSTMNRQEMADQAVAATMPPNTGAQTGNCIAIFTMYILQDLLVQQLVNPVNNFNNIIAVAATIAALNSSVKSIQ
jgi:hypothetical protein